MLLQSKKPSVELIVFDFLQDEEVSKPAVDALKDVSSEARQKQEGQEKEQAV